MKTPIRYAGGKSRAKKSITPYVEDQTKIVSPFMGGGSLEVYWASMGKEVIGYDVFDMLVNFWDVVLSKPDELADELIKITPDNSTYAEIKEILMTLDKTQSMLSGWKTDHYKRTNIKSLDEVVSAAYYYFNHNTSYGPGYLGWGSSLYLNDESWNKMVDQIRTFKCDTLKVYQKDFSESIPEHKDDFLYLDPPYFLDSDSDNKMFTGIYPMRNIPVHHDQFSHELLRDMVHEHQGEFVLSYNNCESIRNYYRDFDFQYPDWNYSMGNGESMIGKNRKRMGIKNHKESHEILITSKGISIGLDKFMQTIEGDG